MNLEIEITKSDLTTLRQRMGIKTNTKAEVIIKSLITLVKEDEHALTYSQYEI